MDNIGLFEPPVPLCERHMHPPAYAIHAKLTGKCLSHYVLSHHVQELAHVDNPVMVMTVSILMVFVFESIVRVFGFRWALLNGSRILDFADVIVVVISVVVYACMLLTNGDVIGKFSVFARVMRFLRIIKFARRLRKWVGHNKRRYHKGVANVLLMC